jgi:hypothetical protein
MATVNLYVSVQNVLFDGRNVSACYTTDSGAKLRIRYLSGILDIYSMSPSLTEEDLDDILSQINVIQAAGCYPQTATACELDFTQT